MIVAIHQPNYLPWLGYFYKMANCDLFVFLDDVLHSKSGFTHRNKIKTREGTRWLTVPLPTKEVKINELLISNDRKWQSKHRNIIGNAYRGAFYFEKYGSFFERIYKGNWEKLVDLNEILIKLICELLGIKNVKTIRASELAVSGTKTELIINICKAVGADTYLSGFGGKKYMDEGAFEKEGIKLEYYDFEHPTYRQLWGDFIPNLSIIDLLFNEGERSLEILKGKA